MAELRRRGAGPNPIRPFPNNRFDETARLFPTTEHAPCFRKKRVPSDEVTRPKRATHRTPFIKALRPQPGWESSRAWPALKHHYLPPHSWRSN